MLPIPRARFEARLTPTGINSKPSRNNPGRMTNTTIPKYGLVKLANAKVEEDHCCCCHDHRACRRDRITKQIRQKQNAPFIISRPHAFKRLSLQQNNTENTLAGLPEFVNLPLSAFTWIIMSETIDMRHTEN
jgi:hypothetical protein